MLDEAEGFADLGMWQESWQTIESLPADERSCIGGCLVIQKLRFTLFRQTWIEAPRA